MFVLFLKFSDGKSKAADFMKGHNEWIQKGLEEGVFLVVGNLQPNAGGAVIMNGMSPAEAEERVQQDPFVAEDIVKAEIHEISQHTTDPRLSFLLD